MVAHSSISFRSRSHVDKIRCEVVVSRGHVSLLYPSKCVSNPKKVDACLFIGVGSVVRNLKRDVFFRSHLNDKPTFAVDSQEVVKVGHGFRVVIQPFSNQLRTVDVVITLSLSAFCSFDPSFLTNEAKFVKAAIVHRCVKGASKVLSFELFVSNRGGSNGLKLIEKKHSSIWNKRSKFHGCLFD